MAVSGRRRREIRVSDGRRRDSANWILSSPHIAQIQNPPVALEYHAAESDVLGVG